MRDVLLGAIAFFLGLSIIWQAREFPLMGDLQYGASLFPTITGVGLALSGVAMMLANLKLAFQGLKQIDSGKLTQLLRSTLRAAFPCLMIVIYVLFSDVIGAFPMLALCMFALFCLGAVKPLISVTVSLFGAFIVYYVFTRYLIVPLPAGWLG